LRWREATILSLGMLAFSFVVILVVSLLARRSGRRAF
jgi:molybdate transport system permease protein